MKSFQMELSLFIESYEYIDLKKGRKIMLSISLILKMGTYLLVGVRFAI